MISELYGILKSINCTWRKKIQQGKGTRSVTTSQEMLATLNRKVMVGIIQKVTSEKRLETGRAWWLMPVIPDFGRLRQADHLSPGVQDQLGQRSETLSLLKIQKKLASRGGTLL